MNIFRQDVCLKTVCNLLWDKYKFVLATAFRIFDPQFPFLDIHDPQFKHLSDSHTAPGHQFHHEPVSWLFSFEDYLIDNILFQNRSCTAFGDPEQFLEYGCFSGIGYIKIGCGDRKIEERFEESVFQTFCGLFLAFAVLGKEIQDVFRGQVLYGFITEKLLEFVEKQPVILDRFFSPNSIPGNA